MSLKEIETAAFEAAGILTGAAPKATRDDTTWGPSPLPTKAATDHNPWVDQLDCTRGTITLRNRKSVYTAQGCERGLLARLKHLFHMNVRLETANFGTVYLSRKAASKMILDAGVLQAYLLKDVSLSKIEAAVLKAARKLTDNEGPVTLRDLPPLALERIFGSLGPKDGIAFAKASPGLLLPSYLSNCQQRCQLLLESDAQVQAFRRFGIQCPRPGAATDKQMSDMCTRVRDIMRETNDVLECWFLEKLPYAHTAEEMVWRLPPAYLQGLLRTAYQCSLYRLFADYVAPPTTGRKLRRTAASIRAWLAAGGASQITYLNANGRHLTCIPSEISSMTHLTHLLLLYNRIAYVPHEVARLPALRDLRIDFLCFRSLSPELRHSQRITIPRTPPRLGELAGYATDQSLTSE